MKILIAAALAALFLCTARAGVIGGTHDHMGPGMGPVIDASRIADPAPGFSTSRQMPQEGVPPTRQASGPGDFRTLCGYSHMSFDDPLVWPGLPGKSHLHVFFGNSSTDAFSSDASLMAAASTCRGGTDNRSAYWVPATIDTRTGAAVKPKSLLVYYKADAWDLSPFPVLAPMPLGLRMIAGNAKGDHDVTVNAQGQPTWVDSHYTYKCIGQDGTQYGPIVQAMPTCPLGADLWQVLSFPRCWDGVHLDSADHRSHMAYPGGGRCPLTHPVALPHLTMIVMLTMVEANAGAYLRLSSDMYPEGAPAGYSFHGDYIAGWAPPVMQQIVDGCLNAGFDCHADLLGNGLMLF